MVKRSLMQFLKFLLIYLLIFILFDIVNSFIILDSGEIIEPEEISISVISIIKDELKIENESPYIITDQEFISLALNEVKNNEFNKRRKLLGPKISNPRYLLTFKYDRPHEDTIFFYEIDKKGYSQVHLFNGKIYTGTVSERVLKALEGLTQAID